MQCSLPEVRESAVWYLNIWIDSYSSTTLICFITDEVTADQVYWCLWEWNDTTEFLLELIWQRFHADYAFSEDNTTRINTNNSVHISWNFKLSKSFNTCLLPKVHILSCFNILFLEFKTWMGKSNSFKIDNFSFSKHNIDNSFFTADNNDLCVFISLLNCEAWFLNCFLQSIDTLWKSNNTVLISMFQSHI